MKAVLLAAGRGTRLAPLTDSIPKILAPIAGRTLLEHQLDYCERSGVTELAINVHHHADQVVSCLERADPPFAVRISEEPELLGTAGALRPLRDFLTESFVVLYGDVVTNADLGGLLERHRQTGGIGTLAWYASAETEGKGLLELVDGGRVRSFAEKPAAAGETACVNAGIYALDPAILDLIEGDAPDFGHDVFPAVLAAGRALYGHELRDASVADIGSPEALATVGRALASGSRKW